MHPVIPTHANAFQVATHADRIAREQPGNQMALVFSAITAISLGAVAFKTISDMLREKRERNHANGRDRQSVHER